MSLVDLKSQLRGEVIQPGEAGYDSARKLYNAMIDKKPRLIVRCMDAADVIACVNYARINQLLLAVRGGGHNGPGLGGCDDGMVIDLSRLRGVRVDTDAKTAQVAGGCVWGEVDHATHAFGLAVPNGVISTTGVGGLTLGGGIGHLARKYGLTIDNLLAADVVLADGRLVIASESQNPDLFWAIRGGGGNFGIVTHFTFRLHPVDTVIAGPVFWPLEDTPQILRKYEPFITDAPEDLNGFFALMTIPPAPPFPESLHLKKVCGIIWCSTADADTTTQWLQPVQSWAKPLMTHIGPMPLPALQSLFDGLYPSGLQWYWKADFVNELNEPAITQHLKFGSELPTLHSAMHLYPINGAVHRKTSTDTAFSYRQSKWAEVILGVDPAAETAGKITRWAKEYWQAVHPYCAPGAYINFMMEEGGARIEATYGENYTRLRQVKSKFDPDNLFRVNQNIAPKQK